MLFFCILGPSGLIGLTTISILFSRGGKIRGRKISRNSMCSGYLFRGRKISRTIQIREYSENFLHAKNTCYTVGLSYGLHILESFHFPRGPSMYGINYQQSVYMYASSINMFKNKIDKYLVKAGYI